MFSRPRNFHEEHCRGTIAEVLEHFSTNEPRGEIVIIVAGTPAKEKKEHRNKYRDDDAQGPELQ